MSTFPDGPDSYGLGVFNPVVDLGVAAIGHVGGNFGYVSWAACLPETGSVVVVLTNHDVEDKSGIALPLVEALPTPTDPIGADVEVLRYTAGDLVAVDPETGDERVLVEDVGDDGVYTAAWSEDGRWLAFHTLRSLWVVGSSGEPRRIADGDRVLWSWSPTSPTIAYAPTSQENGSLMLIDVASGDVTNVGRVGRINALAWSADGTRVIYTSERNASLSAIDVGSGATAVLAEDLGHDYGGWGLGPSGIRPSPDSASIAVNVIASAIAGPETGPYHLYLMEADGSNIRAISESVQDAVWAPDGARLAYATYTSEGDGRILRIWTVGPRDATPILVHEETSHTSLETSDLAWSPDGAHIAFATDTPDSSLEIVHQAISADGSGSVREIDALPHLGWQGGAFYCRCYG